MFSFKIDEKDQEYVEESFRCNEFKTLFDVFKTEVIEEKGLGAAGNTLRSFHRQNYKKDWPNNRECFDVWAKNAIKKDEFITLASCKSDLREWKYEQASTLQKSFYVNGVIKKVGVTEEKDKWRFVKLIDLFIKNRILHSCGEIKDDLIKSFDVPLDSFSLKMIRRTYNLDTNRKQLENKKKMPSNASMGWITSRSQYELIQMLFSAISNDNAFKCDILAWNFGHLNGLERALLKRILGKN